MDIKFSNAAIQDIACDALVVGVAYQQTGQRSPVFSRTARAVDDALDGLLQELFASGEFKGEVGELATVHTMGKLATRRVVLVGLGKLEKLNTLAIQRACGTATRHAQQTGAHTIALDCLLEDAPLDVEAQTQAALEGALLGAYTFKKYQQSVAHSNGRGISKIDIVASVAQHPQLETAKQRAIALAESTNFTRVLVNDRPIVL